MRICITLLAAIALLAVPATGDELSVSITSSRDNTVYEGLNDNSNGAGPDMFAGRTQFAGVRRALLAFDVLGSLGAGARINSVSLTLTADQLQTAAGVFGLHRVSADWGEGTSIGLGNGAPATPGDATWSHRFHDTVLWTTAGGDFIPGTSGTISIGAAGIYTWNSTSQLVSDVQGWVTTPANNFGWLIKEMDEVNIFTAKRFGTREHPNPSSRPMLTINYNIGGDATLDNMVNLDDFNVLAANFGQSNRTFEQGDFDLSGVVNLADFNILAGNFGFSAASGPTPQDWATLAALVPEPAHLSLLALGALTCLRRRRHL